MKVAVRTLASAFAIVLLAAMPAAGAGRCGERPWCDTSLTPDERAGLLLDSLTSAEKISLLGGDDVIGVAGGDHTHTGTSNGIARLGLPTTYFSDGPVGPRQGRSTAMPIPMALAATFDPSLARLHGATIASEVRAKGNDVVYAPTVNIMRTPRNGRTFEAYGEDPWLVARLTAQWIEGAQGEGVIANVKHFAANNQEGEDPTGQLGMPGMPLGAGVSGNRLVQDSVVSERTLREIYLPQFEAAVKEAHVGSVMCSYNRLNGQYACENEELLQQILRRDWGFKGFVIADYGAAHNTIASLNNGLDFEPWPGIAYTPAAVTAALAAGLVSTSTIDAHVRAILRTLFAFGFFDRDGYRDDDAQIDKPRNAAAAETIEEHAITLLQNEGNVLPFDPARLKTLAVIGEPATQFVTGGGSGNVKPFAFVTPLDAIKARVGPGVNVIYDDGQDAAAAAATARAADAAIVFAGDYETEGADRQCLSLECPNVHGDQDGMISAVVDAQHHTAVVLETGGPVLTPWRETVPALLEAWYPGSQGGTAIARVLFGDADPSGRLPATFPRSEADLPTAGDTAKYPGVANTVTYREGVLVGYRWYDARGLTPAFPFGHGLSYTNFRMRKLRLSRTGVVRASITNTGARTGIAVPQLYLSLPAPSETIIQPPLALKGVVKRTIAPGRTRRVTFRLDRRAFSYWSTAGDEWRVTPGCYGVSVGSSSRAIALRRTYAVRGARCARSVKLSLPKR